MSISVRTSRGKRKITIAGELTIYTVAEIKQKFFANLDKCKEVVVDLAKVSEFDSAGLQLLASGKVELDRANKPWALSDHSKAVLSVLNVYHLDTQLEQATPNAQPSGDRGVAS